MEKIIDIFRLYASLFYMKILQLSGTNAINLRTPFTLFLTLKQFVIYINPQSYLLK